MSGICGICQPGVDLGHFNLQGMLSALALPGEPRPARLAGKSVALGLAARWPFQQLATIPGVSIAVDADLCKVGDLASTLAAEGVGATGMSLAETLAWLYVRRGLRFVEQLQGAFAFALWDEKARRLVVGIDRLGIKGLYWRQENGRLLFSSRVGAIRAAQSDAAEVNPLALMKFILCSVVPAPDSIYRGTEKLLPGFLLIYEDGQVRKQSYWDLEFPESTNREERFWAGEVRERMRSAVHLHLDGCSPQETGAYLSGGTDSSSVVAFIDERQSPVNTFSISFEELHYNEIGFARVTSERFHTHHHERCLNPEDAYLAISKLADFYDEPLANSSAIGAYHCAATARECGMSTLLAGDGGDELFAGNERYAKDKYFALYHSLPGWARRGLIEPIVSLLPGDGSLLSRPRRYVQRAQIPNPRRILSYGLFLSLPHADVFEPGFLAAAPPERWLETQESHFQRAHASSELNRLLYLDVKMTLADNDLRKVTGTAELAGIRVRFPLLDHSLAEFSGRIPSALKLKGFEKRYIFKKAMEGILPAQVLYKKKHGFGVPLGLWMQHDRKLNGLMEDVLLDPRTRQRGYFRPQFLDFLLDRHRRDYAPFYGEYVWRLLALELWHRQHLERARVKV